MSTESNVFTLEQQFGLNSLELLANNLEKKDLVDWLLTERRSVYILQNIINCMIESDLYAIRCAIKDEVDYDYLT